MHILIGIFVIIVLLGILWNIIKLVFKFAASLIAALLFRPRINTVLSVGLIISGLIRLGNRLDWPLLMPFLFLVYLLPVWDCIYDFIRAPFYYKKDGFDTLYMLKSISSLLTLFLARYAFFIFIEDRLYSRVIEQVYGKLQKGEPLLPELPDDALQAEQYYYAQQIEKLQKKGRLVSNRRTVNSEAETHRKKLSRMYPKKLLEKLMDTLNALFGDGAAKKAREDAEYRIALATDSCVYLGTNTFNKLSEALPAAMSHRGVCPLSSIKEFEELRALGLSKPVNGKNDWADYFIIMALQPLVQQGSFEDEDYNDNDPFDNHAYHYAKSTVSMPSIDADNDPRFALD